MKDLHSTVFLKGQITVPNEVREFLGLREGDRVNVILRDGRVEVERAGNIIARTAGIFSGRATVMTAEELRNSGEQAVADEVVKAYDV